VENLLETLVEPGLGVGHRIEMLGHLRLPAGIHWTRRHRRAECDEIIDFDVGKEIRAFAVRSAVR
jgi:hypothetical protein